MAEDLCYNLKANGEKFIWDGTLDYLKKFVADELKLLGKWISPGGETKLFTSGLVCLKWQSKTSKWITVYGSPNEVNDVTEHFKSMCEVATIDSINVDECGVDSSNNDDHAEASIDEPTVDEIVTGMLNESNLTIPISSSTEHKFSKDKLSNIEAEVKFLEAKFLDKTLSLTNDRTNLKKYCLDNSTEYVNSLRHENASLKDENRALKDSLAISKFALSDLNTKVKELENEKSCLTTSLKIIYQDFHQSHEHCSNKQEVAASTDKC
jgi:regulator of replication initiation timing